MNKENCESCNKEKSESRYLIGVNISEKNQKPVCRNYPECKKAQKEYMPEIIDSTGYRNKKINIYIPQNRELCVIFNQNTVSDNQKFGTESTGRESANDSDMKDWVYDRFFNHHEEAILKKFNQENTNLLTATFHENGITFHEQ